MSGQTVVALVAATERLTSSLYDQRDWYGIRAATLIPVRSEVEPMGSGLRDIVRQETR